MSRLSHRTEWWICNAEADDAQDGPPLNVPSAVYKEGLPSLAAARKWVAARQRGDGPCDWLFEPESGAWDPYRDGGFRIVRVEYHEEPTPPKAKARKTKTARKR